MEKKCCSGTGSKLGPTTLEFSALVLRYKLHYQLPTCLVLERINYNAKKKPRLNPDPNPKASVRFACVSCFSMTA